MTDQWTKSLSSRLILTATLIVCGLLSGPSTLKSADASSPPLQWTSLPLIFIGSGVGVIFVIWIQNANKSAHLFWKFFLYGSIYMLSSGTAALGLSLWQRTFGPSALLFITIAAGMIVGLTVRKP